MASIRRLLVSVVVLLGSATLPVAQASEAWQKLEGPAQVMSFPVEFRQAPPESPEYMVDNTGNKRGVAPIHGTFLWHRWNLCLAQDSLCLSPTLSHLYTI